MNQTMAITRGPLYKANAPPAVKRNVALQPCGKQCVLLIVPA